MCAMADRRSEARYSTITAPADTDLGELNELASQKAQTLAGPGEMVMMVGVLEGLPSPDQDGMIEYRIQYTVIPPAPLEQ
jgi:hypothetical protein